MFFLKVWFGLVWFAASRQGHRSTNDVEESAGGTAKLLGFLRVTSGADFSAFHQVLRYSRYLLDINLRKGNELGKLVEQIGHI